MTDRELLDMAARTLGKNIIWEDIYGNQYSGNPGRRWNPLADDGDAIRLAMALELGVVCKRQSDQYERNVSVVTNPYGISQLRVVEKHKGRPEEATRRAIVRAAAETWLKRGEDL